MEMKEIMRGFILLPPAGTTTRHPPSSHHIWSRQRDNGNHKDGNEHEQNQNGAYQPDHASCIFISFIIYFAFPFFKVPNLLFPHHSQ